MDNVHNVRVLVTMYSTCITVNILIKAHPRYSVTLSLYVK